MTQSRLTLQVSSDKLSLIFSGECTLHTITRYEKQIKSLSLQGIQNVVIDLNKLTFLDTAGALFLLGQERYFLQNSCSVVIEVKKKELSDTLALVRNVKQSGHEEVHAAKKSFLHHVGVFVHTHLKGFFSFFSFLGMIFATKFFYLKSLQNIRYKEIAFEINESAIKALLIIGVTSFLIGVVVAYQSAYQLKLYGANIFIVDMLGLSILRELSPLITAIVIAGRSGSAFAAQIGAMKITEELDAMRTMGFDPYVFLVIPRILALMIVMPLLIFVSDVMALLGGMIIANVDLDITVDLFLDRFADVIALKHFVVGVVKGPFFAFLIATIGIYRGLMVQNDTQSIGFNTTRSVVEAIFAVIVCDAIFSVAFTSLGI